jgi:hypothetical protein
MWPFGCWKQPRRSCRATVSEAAVLLLGRAADAEFTGLESLLRRAGIAVHRRNAEDLNKDPFSIDLADGTIISLDQRLIPTVVWLRHFTARASIPVSGDSADGIFNIDSWSALAGQLRTVCASVIGGGTIGHLSQLVAAKSHGLRVPRTIVTTEQTAAKRLASDRYVVKAVDRHYVESEPGRLTWFHAQVVDRGRLGDDLGFPPGPVVIQEYVPHDAELRVYVVGKETHCFEIHKDSAEDIWNRPDSVEVRYRIAPSTVIRAAQALADKWGLAFGAFDFLVDGREPVFLEVNHDGDWHWFEGKADVDFVSRAALRTVRDFHRAAGASSPPYGFDILDFLLS